MAPGTAGALSRNWFGVCEERLTILVPGMTPGPVTYAPMTALAASSGRSFQKGAPVPCVTRVFTFSVPSPPEHCRNAVAVVPWYVTVWMAFLSLRMNSVPDGAKPTVDVTLMVYCPDAGRVTD